MVNFGHLLWVRAEKCPNMYYTFVTFRSTRASPSDICANNSPLLPKKKIPEKSITIPITSSAPVRSQ
jgi:hypothetical protein